MSYKKSQKITIIVFSLAFLIELIISMYGSKVALFFTGLYLGALLIMLFNYRIINQQDDLIKRLFKHWENTLRNLMEINEVKNQLIAELDLKKKDKNGARRNTKRVRK